MAFIQACWFFTLLITLFIRQKINNVKIIIPNEIVVVFDLHIYKWILFGMFSSLSERKGASNKRVDVHMIDDEELVKQQRLNAIMIIF